MQVLTQESQKLGLIPAITDSKETGAHLSIYIPLDEGSTDFVLRSVYESLYSDASVLLQKSMKRNEIESYMKPIKALFRSHAPDPAIRGLAIFRSKESFYHTYLQEPPPQLVVVASSFHIKPLIHSISTLAECFAITVTPKQLKIFKVSGNQASLVQTYSNELESGTGKKDSGFTGQRKRDKEVNDRFIREVTRQLVSDFKLRRYDVAVLGSQPLRKRLLGELFTKTQIKGFYESTIFPSIAEMCQALESALKAKNRALSQKYVKQLVKASADSIMTDSLQDIATAAIQGRIERLIIDPAVQIWGVLDRSSGFIRTHAEQISDEDDCVIDDIAEEVMKKGGDVVFFDSSQLENVAPYIATLRW